MDAPQLLRARREAAGMSRERLSLAAGVSASAIAKYESGDRHARPDHAQKLDVALGADGEIAAAFGYSAQSVLARRLDAVEAVARAQAQVVRFLATEALGRLDAGDELAARLADLERLLGAQQVR
jgi:transcriptional regulator with XRE-family HTH domain